MEIETNEGKRYKVLEHAGKFWHPRLVLLRELTKPQDWQVVDSETSRGCIGVCDKDGYSFSIAHTIRDGEFYVTEVKPSPEGDNFLLGCRTHYQWSEDKHHMDVEITPCIKNKLTRSFVSGKPKVMSYGDPSATATEIESVIQEMTKYVGSRLKFPDSYKDALEQGWVESQIVTESEERVATNYEFPTDYNSTLGQGSVNTEGDQQEVNSEGNPTKNR